MRRAGIDLACARLEQRFGGLHQRSRSVDDVIEDQRSAAFNITDHVHHFGDVHVGTTLIHDGQRSIELLSKEARAFHATRVG